MLGGGRLLITAFPDDRSSPRHRRAAPPVGMGDQPRCGQGSRANGDGDAEIGQPAVNQPERRVIPRNHSQRQRGNA